MPAIGQPLPSAPRPRSGAAPESERAQPHPLPGATGEDWHLRPITLADAPALAALEQVLFPDEAWDLAMVAEEISHPDRRYVAAVEAAGQIVGYAGIMRSGETADLHTIGTVLPSVGIGRALLAWCIEAARAPDPRTGEPGAKRLLLEVRDDNHRARAFYEAAGFTELGVRRGYYRTSTGRVDARVMELEIPV